MHSPDIHLQIAQKDPKEYLPYLNELAAMTPNMRMYTIDIRLKRTKSALKHIIAVWWQSTFSIR